MLVLRTVIPLLALTACADKGPHAVLDEYRQALEKGDADRALALSDASLRAAYAKRGRSFGQEELKGALARIQEAKGEGTTTFELGAIRMVKESGGWKVARGGLELGRYATPEQALESFFFGVDAKAWDVVRGAIPKRHREAFASDAALVEHLESLKGRIDRARKDLGELSVGRAVVTEDKAEIVYGDGRRVTFEREDGLWCVVDLE